MIAVGDFPRQENFFLDLRNLASVTPFMITSFLLRRFLELYILGSEKRLPTSVCKWLTPIVSESAGRDSSTNTDFRNKGN